MAFHTRLKFFRWAIFFAIIVSIVIYYRSALELSFPDIVLLVTALLIAWYARETLALVELTRTKDQPFLEIELPENGAKTVLKNLGPTPAYSPSIKTLHIGENIFEFDPLYQSRLPIAPNEIREVWMHHKEQNTNESFVHSLPALRNAILNAQGSPQLKIVLQYFDKDGIKLKRNLFIKTGGNQISGDQYIYTSTTSE